MKLLGERSLSSFLKVLLDIAFYLAIAAAGLTILVLAFIGLSGRGNLSQSLPISFEIDPSLYQIESSDGSNVTAVLDTPEANLNVSGTDLGLIFLPVLVVIPVLTVAIVVLHRLRRIFARLKEGRPFLVENARNLRFIGLAVVIGELVWAAFVYWGNEIVLSQLTVSGVTLHNDVAVRTPIILAGLVLLIVAEVFREGAEMKSDLETASEIQFSLVSDPEYRIGPVTIDSRMRPVNTVGGDYYDIIELGDGRIAFVIADVAGKGLPAALLMALLQGSLRSLISSGLRGSELISKLNTYLVDNTPDNRMITCFYGELDPTTGDLDYVNAGHNPPYIYQGETVTRLDSTAVVLGVLHGAPFEQVSLNLAEGARLLLYTDGITEAADPDDEEFGEGRLEQLISAEGDSAPQAFIERIVSSVITFCGKARPLDDMTLMVVSRTSSLGLDRPGETG